MGSTVTDFLKGIISGATGGSLPSLQMAGTIWASVTDYRMWRSFGWLMLGILLIILGFVIWNRHAIGSAASAIAAV